MICIQVYGQIHSADHREVGKQQAGEYRPQAEISGSGTVLVFVVQRMGNLMAIVKKHRLERPLRSPDLL